jgi:glutamate-1-semialdehyde 2,1-aminomutase
MEALGDALRRNGITGQIVGEPPMFDVVFADGAMRDYRDLQRGDKAMARRFNALLRERGILKGEQKYYVSLAHTPDDIRHTKEAWASAIKVLTN